jgi:hypothetical protein
MQYSSATKRPRATTTHHDIDANEITSRINQAVSTRERIVMLDSLLSTLGYNPATRQCLEGTETFKALLHSGAVNALCCQLGFVLYRQGPSIAETEKICILLELFFIRCPELATEDSLSKLGSSFVQLLSKCANQGVLQPVLSIWHTCSASAFGTTLLLQSTGILAIVAKVLHNSEFREEDCLIHTLGLLKNVTYFGEELRLRVAEQPGVLSGLTQLVDYDEHGKLQERVSAVFRNLAISPNTRLLLARNSQVLSALVRMSTCASHHALRNLINTMISLAMDGDSCYFLVFHGDGILIESLKRLLEHDDDAVIRKRASRALRLMARDIAAPFLVQDSQLVEALTRRVLNDASKEVRIEAAEALTCYAGLVKASMGQHDAVLKILTSLAFTPGVSTEAVARAFRAQANHAENRKSLARCDRVIDVLARIAVSDEASQTAKEHVCQALLDISSEEENREMIATPTVFEALVHNLSSRRDDDWRTRESAVSTLANLAFSQSTRRKLATHTNLLQVLLHFAATTPVDTQKKEAKKLILQLASQL